MEAGIVKPQDELKSKYRWYYKESLFRYPTMLFSLYKVFGGIIISGALTLGLINWASSVEPAEALVLLKSFCLVGLIVLMLVTLAYLIYAAVMNGQYCVVFEMDKDSITRTQITEQLEQAQIITNPTKLSSLETSSFTHMGLDILSGSSASRQTKFAQVNRIKVNRQRHIIYLHSGLSWNQIYANNDSFEEILSFILAQVPDTIDGHERLTKRKDSQPSGYTSSYHKSKRS